jgi:hypothetical protein
LRTKTTNPGREQAYLGIILLSREYCKICTISASFCKRNLPVMSKTPKRLQIGQGWPLTRQAALSAGPEQSAADGASGQVGQVGHVGQTVTTACRRRRDECVTNQRRQASSGVAREIFERVQLQNHAGEARCPRRGFSKRARGGDPRPSRARERSEGLRPSERGCPRQRAGSEEDTSPRPEQRYI